MTLKIKAIYKSGHLIFYDSKDIPEDGTEVVLSFDKASTILRNKTKKRGSLRGIWRDSIVDEELLLKSKHSLFPYEDQ